MRERERERERQRDRERERERERESTNSSALKQKQKQCSHMTIHAAVLLFPVCAVLGFKATLYFKRKQNLAHLLFNNT